MLKSHLDMVEGQLLASAGIPAGSGHPVNKGTAREAFLRDFLKTHLSSRLSVDTGEIIDCDSRPGDKRNQIDLVLYRNEYPKLQLGGDVYAFLAESVVATIEVKSVITKEELGKSVDAAMNLKKLRRNLVRGFSSGWSPPAILSYVVAYDGPAKIETVDNWIGIAHAERGVSRPQLPIKAPDRWERPAASLDGVFVLGKGFAYFDNVPMGLCNDHVRSEHRGLKWLGCNADRGSLFMLFLLLTCSVAGFSSGVLDPIGYVSHVAFRHKITRTFFSEHD